MDEIINVKSEVERFIMYDTYANAKRADMASATAVFIFLSLTFEKEGYIVTLTGSVLKNGQGRDIDIIMIRQREDAMHPTDVSQELQRMGFKQLIEESTEDEYGFVGLMWDRAVDITVMGWGGPEA